MIAFIFLIFLVLKHFLADYLLQPKNIAIGKCKALRLLVYHSFIHSFLTLVIMSFLFLFYPYNIFLMFIFPLAEFFTHCIIDKAKCKSSEKLSTEDFKFWLYYGFDQFLHQIFYIIITIIIFSVQL